MAADVRAGRLSAVSVARAAIEDIRRRDPAINAVTRLLAERGMAEAAAVDAVVAGGGDPGPLAGVPYGVKDLFDVAGLPTTAGAGMRASAPPAGCDAEAIRRLKAAGAVLVATLNMDEYAYGFATINAWTGTTRNPHDPARLAGGSSGGSAAAVASGLLPLTLGSDTNGSIRVPASLTGVYGLKPTHGGLPMAGVFPFVDSFDDIGPFAASIEDLRVAWQVLSGQTAGRPAGEIRAARLGGWFRDGLPPDLIAEVDRVGAALGASAIVDLPAVDLARSAAFVMTAAEGGSLHLPALRREAMAFDPATRDRLIAGALLPATTYVRATRFRQWFAARVDDVFVDHDVLIAPATPATAPPIDDPVIEVRGERVPARAHLGLLTQPLSFIGLPVIAVPVVRDGLPFAVQLVGRPGAETVLFAAAARLEAAGIAGARVV